MVQSKDFEMMRKETMRHLKNVDQNAVTYSAFELATAFNVKPQEVEVKATQSSSRALLSPPQKKGLKKNKFNTTNDVLSLN